MKRKFVFLALLALFAGALVLAAHADAVAQCAMCKSSIEASANGEAVVKGLNSAILILLVPPASIFCVIFAFAFRYRRGSTNQG